MDLVLSLSDSRRRRVARARPRLHVTELRTISRRSRRTGDSMPLLLLISVVGSLSKLGLAEATFRAPIWHETPGGCGCDCDDSLAVHRSCTRPRFGSTTRKHRPKVRHHFPAVQATSNSSPTKRLSTGIVFRKCQYHFAISALAVEAV